ncbi:MAG: hypothetical protein IJ802_01735 [Kiritimatiellae bacterium]|nr:hypothetical protein [Kiritimatiellia bacterium]
MKKIVFAMVAVFAGAMACAAAGMLRATKPIERTDDVAQEIKDAPLFRRKMAIIGDSYVQNHKRPIEETWHYRLAEKYQMEYLNYGHNGNTLVLERDKKWGAPMISRYAKMQNGADYVVVVAGHNDASMMGCDDLRKAGASEEERAAESERRFAQFKEGVPVFVARLRAKYPASQIVFVSPWNVQRPYFQKTLQYLRETLPGLGVAFYDAARDSGIDPHMGEGKTEIFQGKSDNAHLTAKGHGMMLEKIEPFFLALPPPPAADSIEAMETGGEAAVDPDEQVVEGLEDLKIILCAGQSNMAGRAKPAAGDGEVVQDAYKFNREGKWVAAKSPYHFDRKYAAVGPVDDFVKLYLADHPGEKVGVVPCAVGGSAIATWLPGGKKNGNFRRAVARAKAAAKDGRIIAILWHQGESDAAKRSVEDLQANYAQEVAAVANALRSELGLGDDVPFIAGEIGRWMRKDGDHAAKINPTIDSIKDIVPNSAVVLSTGLTNQDQHHFDRESQRVLAKRYYEAFKSFADGE